MNERYKTPHTNSAPVCPESLPRVLRITLVAGLCMTLAASSVFATDLRTTGPAALEHIAPGIWRIRLGTPEKFTPVGLNPEPVRIDALSAMPTTEYPALNPDDIRFRTSPRGCVVELPMTEDEHIFGFGLQFTCFNALNRAYNIVVSDHPGQGDGSSHAPVPFYVSTKGYGIFVDTLRYARFYCANLEKAQPQSNADPNLKVKTDLTELYKPREVNRKFMTVDIPAVCGTDIYIFGGPALSDAVRRYNLFAGGGTVPPLWGLGIFYRGDGRFNAEQILNLADYFRKARIPCTVLGLEPGWHTHAYSCSYRWSGRYPDPDAFIEQIKNKGYHLNLWEQAFVHPTAEFYDAIRPYSGDYLVWDGLVPDFTLPEARTIFTRYHAQKFLQKGITGFKLDECDNQPYKGEPWSFPECSRFPSGMDGEQMHSLFGLTFQRTMNALFREHNLRTWSQVRASHALASSMPFVLYSDAYEHRDYVRALLNSGFSGLLWQPEVRTADSVEDLYRRIQTAVFSPQTLVNAWFIPNVPWNQFDADKNNRNTLREDRHTLESIVRDLFELRMRLVPYLYSSFMRYRNEGLPPFRALVMDYPDDPQTYHIDDEYLVGPSLLVAPLFGKETQRSVYLPEGIWYCFWTKKKYAGGQTHSITAPREHIPVFVKAGSILPLAAPVEYISPDTVFDITVQTYGESCRDFVLYEDDGQSFDFEKGRQNQVTLSWNAADKVHVSRKEGFDAKRYRITARHHIDSADVIDQLASDALSPGAVRLESLDLSHMDQAAGSPRARASFDSNPITLGKTVFAHGVGTHAWSEFVIDLNRAATRFESAIGIDAETQTRGSAVFQVLVDGVLRFDSGIMRGQDTPQAVSINLDGAERMTLLVTDAGDGIGSDHADWAGARIHLKAGATSVPRALGISDTAPVELPLNTAPDPSINGPRVIGTTPGKPFLHLIPASGQKPLVFSAKNLPDGLELNPQTGILSGRVTQKGIYVVHLTVENTRGKCEKPFVIVAGQRKLALTPPMGWNSWNVWACSVDEQKIRDAIDGLIESGLAAHGYQYVNIDDCWMGRRDENGMIQPNEKFSDMKALADYAHRRGIKLGIYSSPGEKTCAGYEGSFGHEQQDTAAWAEWGIDYVKYDWCSYDDKVTGPTLEEMQRPYRLMGELLDSGPRDIIYSLCQYGMGDVWQWGDRVGGNLWRTTGDITDTWSSFSNIGFRHSELAPYVKPGRWNDPDMLVVGKLGWGGTPRPTQLSRVEQVTHMTLWCLLAAPLLTGCDLTDLDPFTLALLCNDEVIAVNQDPLGNAASRKSLQGSGEVWSRPLCDGTWAVGLFNRGLTPLNVTAEWPALGIRDKQPVRDLWRYKDLGIFEESFTAELPPHGCVLLKIGRPDEDDLSWIDQYK